MRVLVTGGNGFIGKAVVERLACEGFSLRASLRRKDISLPANVEQVVVGSLAVDTRWQEALEGVSVVVHAAARVHATADTVADLQEFRVANVAGTLNLACQAAENGVERFVFLSSIKVNGENTKDGKPFCADDPPAAEDPYGISKMEAEQALWEIAAKTGMEVVIIRPPLVYGPRVKANYLTMMQWLHRGIPLPLGAIHNKRSLVALDNLVDLIIICLNHLAAANQVFLVGDGEDVSTTELLRRTGVALGRPPLLVPVPVSLLKWGAALLGRRDLVQKLCCSLQVDISKTRKLLNWYPPISLSEGIHLAAQDFLLRKKNHLLPRH